MLKCLRWVALVNWVSRDNARLWSAANAATPKDEQQHTNNLRDLGAEEGVRVTPDQEMEEPHNVRKEAVVSRAQTKSPKPRKPMARKRADTSYPQSRSSGFFFLVQIWKFAGQKTSFKISKNAICAVIIATDLATFEPMDHPHCADPPYEFKDADTIRSTSKDKVR